MLSVPVKTSMDLVYVFMQAVCIKISCVITVVLTMYASLQWREAIACKLEHSAATFRLMMQCN